MGIALLYGSTGTLSYAGLTRELESPSVPGPVVSVAVVLTVVGLLFKLGAVPFHVWVPDTYRGASVMVAGFLASVSKAAALGALLVLLALGLGPADGAWQPVIAVVAAASMTIGNLGALRQRDGVAMLAWSSVAQAGFLIAPAAAIFTSSGLSAPLQYLAVYALANVVGFAALAVVLRTRGSTDYDELAGLARTDPWLGVPLAFAVLTLAGFPPAVVGLVTKYVVLRPVVEGDVTWLAVVMAVNVMLGLAYYLRLVVVVVGPPQGEPYRRTASPYPVHLAVGVVALGTLALVVLSAWPDLLIANLP
jgi:NADH-quinone oxidoreductase subunit N